MLLYHSQKSKERIEKFKETGDVQYIYRNELDKACFEHDMSYWDFKDPASDKISRNKAFNIVKNPNDVYRRGRALMVHTFFDKKLLEVVLKWENVRRAINYRAEELPKPIIKKFEKRKVQSLSMDNICGADLADMQLT